VIDNYITSEFLEWLKYKTAKPLLLHTVYRTRNTNTVQKEMIEEKR